MNYTISTKGAGVKQVTLENGQIGVMSKTKIYGNRFMWVIRKDRETIATGINAKECAQDFAKWMN